MARKTKKNHRTKTTKKKPRRKTLRELHQERERIISVGRLPTMMLLPPVNWG